MRHSRAPQVAGLATQQRLNRPPTPPIPSRACLQQYAKDLEQERRSAAAASRKASGLEAEADALRRNAESLGREREELSQQNAQLLLDKLRLQDETSELAQANRMLTDKVRARRLRCGISAPSAHAHAGPRTGLCTLGCLIALPRQRPACTATGCDAPAWSCMSSMSPVTAGQLERRQSRLRCSRGPWPVPAFASLLPAHHICIH